MNIFVSFLCSHREAPHTGRLFYGALSIPFHKGGKRGACGSCFSSPRSLHGSSCFSIDAADAGRTVALRVEV